MSETNRKLVEDLYSRLAAADLTALEALLHPEFLSHNPRVPHDPAQVSGRQAFVDFFRGPPGKALMHAGLTVRRIVADEELVAVHTEIHTNPAVAAVDILRVRDGLVIEHWDVVQPVPVEPANPHGMF